MPVSLSPPMQIFWWSTVGLFVGSFLNVAIYRLPLEGESVNRPRRSRCPNCKNMLTWRENLPVLSWLFQRGACRNCGWRIPMRYPFVEILTAALWYLAAATTPPGEYALVAVRVLVLSGLVVATFVDFDWFEIPDEVSIGGMVVAPLLCALIPTLQAETWIAKAASDVAPDAILQVDRFGAIVGSLAGLAVGWGILWVIGWIGGKLYGIEAMGLGDVKLLAAGGGFVGPGGALVALAIAALVASVVGVLNMLRFFYLSHSRAVRRGRAAPLKSLKVARIAGRYLPFGPYLALGIGIVLLYWNYVSGFLP